MSKKVILNTKPISTHWRVYLVESVNKINLAKMKDKTSKFDIMSKKITILKKFWRKKSRKFLILL